MMKILLVMNKTEREWTIMSKIAHWLKHLAPESRTEIMNYSTPSVIRDAIEFNPHIVLMFPLTSVRTSMFPTTLKMACGSTILTLETEGGTGYDTSHDYIKQFVGYDRYHESLVDFALYWGPHDAEHIGGLFFEEGKISSRDRNVVFGYPMYELYFSDSLKQIEDEKLPRAIRDEFAKFPDDRRILFVTGFHTADYTREDCIIAGDLFDVRSDYSAELEKVLLRVEREKTRREQWIEAIRSLAERRKDTQFVIKYHPIEASIRTNKGHDPYKCLAGLPNVLLVSDNSANLYQLLSRSKALVHYGSTTVVESYLLNKHSIFVYSPDLHAGYEYYYRVNCDPKGWPSTHATTIDKLAPVVDDLLDQDDSMAQIPDNSLDVLKEFFNITDMQGYEPSKQIAEFILSAQDKKQDMPPDNEHVLKHLSDNLDNIIYGVTRTVMTAISNDDVVELDRTTSQLRTLGRLPFSPDVRIQVRNLFEKLGKYCAVSGASEAEENQDKALAFSVAARRFISMASAIRTAGHQR